MELPISLYLRGNILIEAQEDAILNIIGKSIVKGFNDKASVNTFNECLQSYLKKYKNHQIVALVIGDYFSPMFRGIQHKMFDGYDRSFSNNQYIAFKFKKFKILFAVHPYAWFLKKVKLKSENNFKYSDQDQILNLLNLKEIEMKL